MEQRSFSTSDIVRLQNLIDTKNWSIYDIYFGDGSVMEALLNLIKPMNDKQRELTFQILDHYIILKDYAAYAIELLKKIKQIAPSDQNIILTSVKDFKELKTKSGQHLFYEISCIPPAPSGQKIIRAEDPSSKNFQTKDGFKVLIDDYIGSGNQISEMIDYLRENDLSTEFDLIISIAMQNDGYNRLKDMGYRVEALHYRDKVLEKLATTGNSISNEVYEIYDSIEEIAKPPTDYKRGYKSSEAAISMKKTPNNTLPIFWSKGSDKKWPAPFLRP